MKTIFWDMDGTLADLYGIENWLVKLRAEDPSPYINARTMHNMNQLARLMNRLQKCGYKIGIISWLSKNATATYDCDVRAAKLAWLRQHLGSVQFDYVHIVSYGTPKSAFITSESDIIFDDDIQVRHDWRGIAYAPDNMIGILKEMLTE